MRKLRISKHATLVNNSRQIRGKMIPISPRPRFTDTQFVSQVQVEPSQIARNRRTRSRITPDRRQDYAELSLLRTSKNIRFV